MLLLDNIVPDRVVQALGWTIVNSLWQAALAAGLFFLLMLLFRRSSSRLRYYTGILTLLLVAVTAVVTFIGNYNSYDPSVTAAAEPLRAAVVNAQAVPGRSSLLHAVQDYFNRHLPLIVSAWLLGVLILVLRLAGGFLYNSRLKVKGVTPAAPHWQERLETLCRKIVLKKRVSLKESTIARIPMTLGYFKPVIFVPLGLLTGLPHDQVEALLAHELAHIARSDYLVNIFQSLIDIVFFYHPAVHWISSFVRHERELCCDDMAVTLMGNSRSYVRALANIHGWGFTRPGFAMNLARNEQKLFHRIRRIVKMKNKGATSAHGLVVACVLGLLFITFGLSTGTAGILNQPPADTAGTSGDPGRPAPPAGKEKASAKIVAKKFYLESAREAYLELNAEGKNGDWVKFWIQRPDSKEILWKFEEKIKGTKLSFKTSVKIGPGEIMLCHTENCQAKIKLKQEKESFVYELEKTKKEYALLKDKINQLSSRKDDLNDDEKKKLAQMVVLAKEKKDKYRKMEAILKKKQEEKYKEQEKRLKEEELKLEKEKVKKELKQKQLEEERLQAELEREKITEEKEKLEIQKQINEEKRREMEFKRQQMLTEKLEKVTALIEALEAKSRQEELSKKEEDELIKFNKIQQELKVEIEKSRPK